MSGKEKVLIVGCQKTMIGPCVACSRCIEALNNKAGQFANLQDPELIGLLDCGDCPGVAINARLNEFKFWNMPPNGDLPTHIFVGDCIRKSEGGKVVDNCPYAEKIVQTIKGKMTGTMTSEPVKIGTHGMGPKTTFMNKGP